MLVDPDLLQSCDGRRRQPRRVIAEQGRQRLLEVAGRDALQIEDRDQGLQALRPARIGWQQRRCEADTVGIVGRRLPVAHARLAHANRADSGHHLALGQMTVAHDTAATVGGLEISMFAKKFGDLGLHGLGQQGARSVAQHLGELVVERSWLNQLDDVIVGHGISLLRWRSGGLKNPHDMPPSPIHAVTNFRP